jgi:sugar lactone lactonase YvrE
MALAAPAWAANTYISAGFLQFPPSVELGPVSAVAVGTNGDLYVLHRGSPPLVVFDSKGKYLRAWGQGLFKVPHGLRVDRDGNLWITDNGLNTVQRFSPDGKLLGAIAEKLKSPDDIVFNAKGEMYIADTGNTRIVKLSKDGKFLTSWGKKGKGEGEFATAHSLAIDSRGRIYVGDRNNNRVQVFDGDGKFITQWAGFANPFGVLVANGELLVADGEAHKLFQVDLVTGTVLKSFGGPDVFKLPHIMAVDRDGTLYVSEVNGKRVQIFRNTASMSQLMEDAHQPMNEPVQNPALAASMLTASLARGTSKGPKVARRNFIDEHIFGKMERDGVPHAAMATDEEFVRRVYLDATGRIPSPADIEKFLASREANKREKLVDTLLASDAYVDRWTYYFEDLFRAGGRMGYGLNLFHYWIREWIKLDRPYNEVVSDLLSQGGKTSFSSPGGLYFARDFVKAKDDPTAPDAHDLVNTPDTIDEFTVTYSKVFLGINMACISCHDGKHHLEKVNQFLIKKKRSDFFQQAAFFGHTRQIMNWENSNQANQEYTVDDDASSGYDTRAESIVRVPRSGGPNDPKFIITGEGPKPGEFYRDALGRLLTGNIQFGRAFTNRLWSELMGFGIVEPVDDFDLDSYEKQASHPRLLDELAKDFAAHHYSMKHVMRTILTSSAYQLSSSFNGEWQQNYARYYARKYVRMLSAPELHDAILTATAKAGGLEKAAGKDPMVMQMPEPSKSSGEVKGFLKVFGQMSRDDMPKKASHSALQAMVLMQSKVVNEKVLALDGSRVQQLLNDVSDNRALVERLYLATVSRHPSAQEVEIGVKALSADRRRGAENLQWALINSPEFLFNY